MLAAIFAVQMAVDAVALRFAIDTWTSAADGPQKTSAFQVAEGLRDVPTSVRPVDLRSHNEASVLAM